MSKVPLSRIDPAGASNGDLIQRQSGIWVPRSIGEVIPGGSVGEVLTKDSSTDGDWSWQAGGGGGSIDLIEYSNANGFRTVEDFFHFDKLKGLVYSAGGSNIAHYGLGSSHPGIVGLSTSTSVSGSNQLRVALGSGIGPVEPGNGVIFKCGWLVKTPAALSDVSQNYFISAGFNKDFLTVNPMAGIMFYYNHADSGGNWSCQTRKVTAGSNDSTIGNSGVAVAADTWYMLEIEIKSDATEVYFYINGSLVHTATADIPTTDTVGWGCSIQKFAGSTARIFYIDMAYLEASFTTPRCTLA